MGLDMFAFAISKEDAVSAIEIKKDCEQHEIWYWRKHHDLHGWMERLYNQKGGTRLFNCECVELTMDDLDKLEHDIAQFKLPHTEGFFFGNNPPDDESNIEDLNFVAACREVLLTNENYRIYYSSWW